VEYERETRGGWWFTVLLGASFAAAGAIMAFKAPPAGDTVAAYNYDLSGWVQLTRGEALVGGAVLFSGGLYTVAVGVRGLRRG